ncbi:MAG: hypothetical protein GF344_18305 [Chitinivibrionales bacterium]|nr:hypothetical protein [Chitinivibrionales bacterium]MBD3358611.1 hypothetical protein [Chitinivibrionales bacterium]
MIRQYTVGGLHEGIVTRFKSERMIRAAPWLPAVDPAVAPATSDADTYFTEEAHRTAPTIMSSTFTRASSIAGDIKRIIAYHGPCSLHQLQRRLREDCFGATRIGLIQLYLVLRRIDLDTYAKRGRYYRSC